MNRPNILLLFGGQSSEHEISIRTAANIYKAMDREKYDVHLGYIDRNGGWWLLDEWHDEPHTQRHNGLAAVLGTNRFITTTGNKSISVDVVFPALHGKNGEDGTLQGLLELLDVRYVGCGVEASSISMDKHAAKTIVQADGIAVADWMIVRASDDLPVLADVAARLGASPWFVKPSRAGSSVGVSKVVGSDELAAAIRTALQHDDTVVIEREIAGRELEVAILGNPPHHQTSDVGEIIAGQEFYSYDDKYADESSSQTILSADLSDSVRQEIRTKALKIYELLGCRGLARVDFLMDESGAVFFNEVNTLPGFTDISMYPKLWQAQGIEYRQLIDHLIELARE